MGKFTIPVKETDLLVQAKSKSAKQALEEALKALDRKYGGGLMEIELPESLGLEKIKFQEKSSEELQKQANETLDADFERRLKALREEYEDKSRTAAAAGETAKKEGEELSGKLEENYAGAKKNVEDNALKRGLARSSVALGQLESLERDRAAGKSEIDAALSGRLSELDQKIAGLSEELDRAIDEENASHARAVRDEIRALTAEQDKRREEVQKYNNTVEEKEQKYRADRATTAAKQLAETVSRTQEKSENMKQFEKAQAIRDYLDTLPPDAALAFLSSDASLREQAGGYYPYLYNYVKLKTEE